MLRTGDDDYLPPGDDEDALDNELIVYAYDPTEFGAQPFGKQRRIYFTRHCMTLRDPLYGMA